MLMRVTGHHTWSILRLAAGAVAMAGLASSTLAACSEESVDRGTGGSVASGGGSAAGGGGTTTPQGGSGAGTTTTGQGGTGNTGGYPSVTTFADMCAREGVLFCDGFEGAYSDQWMEDGGDVRIISGSAVSGEGSTVVELATYDGQQSSKLIYSFANEPEIYVRFDVQYDQAYDNSGGSHGPILGGSTDPPWGMFGTAGIQPSGDDFMVLNFEPIGTVGVDGELGFYAYFANMQPDGHGDYWGNVFTSTLDPPPTIVRGSWHCAEYGLKLNTSPSTDGTADFWVDGVHHGSFGGFQWRTADALQANTFALDSYNHFNNGAPPSSSPNLVRYDNLVLSRVPVGCLAGS